jgi:hypothetical protein
MKYHVTARVKKNQLTALRIAIEAGTLGAGSVAGTEYIRNMNHARMWQDDTVHWIEVCFCDPPLAEERPYWEEYFELLSIEDAVDRTHCKHENGKEFWSCVSCTCAQKAEQQLSEQGESIFLNLSQS